jgi:hypothetical protein
MKRVLLPLVIAAGLFVPAAVQADAVASRREPCPLGAKAELSHTGPWCQPTTCTTDANCPMNEYDALPRHAMVCRPAVALCVGSRDMTWSRGSPGGKPVLVPEAVSSCGDHGECPMHSTCETARRCVDVEDLKAAETAKAIKCSCQVGAQRGDTELAALFAGALVLGARRRATRRR